MACTDDATSELPVDVTIRIPSFLYFQLGSTNQTPKITFDTTTSGSARDSFNNSSSGDSLNPSFITGSDVTDGVNVTVRANCGQVRLTYAVSDAQGLRNTGGQYIPFNTLQTYTDDAGLTAPQLANTADRETTVDTTSYGSVTDRSTVWRYQYTNSVTPAAGTYQGTVTYQVSCL